MQVILLEKVVNLGGLGDVVRVRDGFARNFLIPQDMTEITKPAPIRKARDICLTTQINHIQAQGRARRQ